jgi:hypothetical protein
MVNVSRTGSEGVSIVQNVVGHPVARGPSNDEPGLPGGAGELVAVEDDATLARKKWYNVVLGSIILCTGVVILAVSTLALVLAGEGMGEDDPLGALMGLFLIGGLVVFVSGTYFYGKSIELRKMQFFDTGIAFSIRYKRRGWRFEHRPWSKMGAFVRKDHWFLGPTLVVDIGIPGEGLLVPGTMERFDDVHQLVSRNLEERV